MQSLAETGTTHGDEPLAHTGDHSAQIPNAGTKSRPKAISASRRPLLARAMGRRHRRTARYLYTADTPRILTTPRASAYIKIAEGCDHPCSFCIIPQLRGKFRSRPMASIVAEAQNLIAQGVREITLIGQDTTCYGEDLGFTDGLADLLNALAAPRPQVAALPLRVPQQGHHAPARDHRASRQHREVSRRPAAARQPNVLSRMKRGGNAEIFLQIIDKARSIVPGLVLRTSFIVGFPGETDEDFAEL